MDKYLDVRGIGKHLRENDPEKKSVIRWIDIKTDKVIEQMAREIYKWHIGNYRGWDDEKLWEGPPREGYLELAQTLARKAREDHVRLHPDQRIPSCPDFGYGLDAAAWAQKAMGEAMLKDGWVRRIKQP